MPVRVRTSLYSGGRWLSVPELAAQHLSRFSGAWVGAAACAGAAPPLLLLPPASSSLCAEDDPPLCRRALQKLEIRLQGPL